jgi:hypothetical protein
MKCISCEVVIDPKWKFAIDNNACPFCGQIIMEEELKVLLTTLGEAMIGLSKYPEQLNDWLFSNHNYIKTDSPEIQKFLPQARQQRVPVHNNEEAKEEIIKVKNDRGEEEEVLTKKIKSDADASDFFKRAGHIKKNGPQTSMAERTSFLKEMKEKIEKAGITGGSVDMNDDMDSEYVGETGELFSEENSVASSFAPNMDDEELPAVVRAMVNKNGGMQTNSKDVQKLQEMLHKSADSSNRMNSGLGSFSRG